MHEFKVGQRYVINSPEPMHVSHASGDLIEIGKVFPSGSGEQVADPPYSYDPSWVDLGYLTLVSEETPDISDLLEKSGVSVKDGLRYEVEDGQADNEVGLMPSRIGWSTTYTEFKISRIKPDKLDAMILALIDLKRRWDAGERPE